MLKGAFSLTQQAKILSFDEAKRERSTRGAHSSSHSTSRTREREHAMHAQSRTPGDPFAGSRASSRDTRESSERAAARKRIEARRGLDAQRRSSSRLNDDAYAQSRLAYDDSEDAEEAVAPRAEKESRIAQLRRNRSKSKADKAFTRQYGDGGSASAQDAGPRAAVYKGEMGQSHRRASRMQEESGAREHSSSRASATSHIPRLFKRPWFIACAGGAVCLALTTAFLYPSAAQLYHSARERDQLQAEYAAIEQRNDAIQSSVDALSTDAGVEDRAHKEFGWVSKGENAVTVYGLDVDDDSTFRASIVPGSVPAPETWYSKLFGPLFGEE